MTISPFTPREQLVARIEALEAQLRKDRDQFLFYGRNHRAKAAAGPEGSSAFVDVADTLAKAETNERMAIDIANLLNDAKPSDDLTPSADVS